LKKKLLRRTSIIVFLFALLVFSALPFNSLFVQADPIGVGKFLTVEIDGDGYVTATKTRSGEVWYYYKTVIATEHKLGAGTVLVQAYANEGWEFSHWEVDLNGTENPVEYKSEKYKILDVEDLDNLGEFLVLRCVKKGTETLGGNLA